jgi:hypothetical protein
VQGENTSKLNFECGNQVSGIDFKQTNFDYFTGIVRIMERSGVGGWGVGGGRWDFGGTTRTYFQLKSRD